jgi:hypothetical protein
MIAITTVFNISASNDFKKGPILTKYSKQLMVVNRCRANAGHPLRRGISIPHNCSGILDRPLEPVIGRRTAPIRWWTMTAVVIRNTACPNFA